MKEYVTVAVSPCPNDTIIFAAWALGVVPEIPGAPARFLWEDVQTLNDWAEGKGLGPLAKPDVIKLSAAAALDLSDYVILDSGAAFGQGCGPKLITRPGVNWEKLESPTVAIPGDRTTAASLLHLAMKEAGRPYRATSMTYDRIKDAVLDGGFDAGVLIHETALAWERHGLALLVDLGRWWQERTSGLPLPLGVIAARRDLGPDLIAAVERKISESLEAARREKARVWPLVRSLAQELDDDTLEAHIETYVSDMSASMGERGRQALTTLAGRLS